MEKFMSLKEDVSTLIIGWIFHAFIERIWGDFSDFGHFWTNYTPLLEKGAYKGK